MRGAGHARAALLLLAALPCAAAAGEHLYQFRSVEDAALAPEARAFCASAPFAANVPLGARLLLAAPGPDAELPAVGAREVGTAFACARIVDPRFPPGLPVEFYVRFQLPRGTFTALGACTLVSNDVPRAGVVLAGCHLRLTALPEGLAGGVATSASVFNPGKVPGHPTGSTWTLHVFAPEAPLPPPEKPRGPGEGAPRG